MFVQLTNPYSDPRGWTEVLLPLFPSQVIEILEVIGKAILIHSCWESGFLLLLLLFFFFSFFFFFFFFLVWPLLWHVEVPGPGIESEL